MPKEKKECPYEEVTGKIDIIDKKLKETSEKLKKLCDEMQEECQDVIESEKALQKTLDKFFLNEFMSSKIIGEA